MKKRINWIILVLIILGFASPIIYPFFLLSGSQYWDNFFSNLFATMIGVLLGIPIALEIHRIQQEKETQESRIQQQKEASERKEKILWLLFGELIHSAYVLESSRTMHDDTPSQRVVFLDDSVKDELWRAFSDGGEIEWIKDLDLLDNIAYAYHYINIIKQFEKRYLDVEFSIMKMDYKRQLKEKIAESLLDIQNNASHRIGKAIEDIQQHLGA